MTGFFLVHLDIDAKPTPEELNTLAGHLDAALHGEMDVIFVPAGVTVDFIEREEESYR